MNELGALNAKVDHLAVNTANRFERTDGKIDHVAFKLDNKIDMVEIQLNGRIDKAEIRLNGRIDQVEARLETKIAESRAELIRWVVGVGILQSSLISALLLKMIV
jgi:hypothetical protein